MDLADLRAFVTVVRAGSFTAAAGVLETDKAHVSRLVSRLEKSLGAQLLTRSTRALAVTEIGRDVFERGVGVLAAVEETRAAAFQAQSAPTGLLKITCGEEFGLLVVSKWIIAYQKRYDAMRVEADLTNRMIDVIHEGFDLAIRVGELPDAGLSARKLGEVSYALYASPPYLEARGEPANVENLAAHDLLLSASAAQSGLELRRGEEKIRIKSPARFAANNNAVLRQAAVAGIGIALLPTFQARPFVATAQLREVLAGWTRPPVPVHAVFSSSRFLAPKVRAFVDLARASFDQTLAAI